MANCALDRPLVGFRVWVVDRRAPTPRLRSISWDLIWDAGCGNEARCLELHYQDGHFACRENAWHRAPAANCVCGLYAYDSLAPALTHVRFHHPFPDELAVGAVLLWGAPGRPVRVGELADRVGLRYRAPFARPLALLDPGRPADPHRLRDDTAAHHVGVANELPVLSAVGLELYAREHGVRLRAEEVAS